jgi:hypothetical protein
LVSTCDFDILKVTNIAEEIQGYQQKWSNHLERMKKDHLPQLAIHYD